MNPTTSDNSIALHLQTAHLLCDSFFERNSIISTTASKMLSKDKFVDLLLLVQALCIFSFLISSFVVSGNDYAGFLAVFTGLVFLGHFGYELYCFKKSINRFNFGILLGGAFMLLFISLQTAIFWGQYGDCQKSMSIVLALAQL